MYNPFSLSGKTIIVTGASSGIGRAVAIECSKMGAQVIILGRNLERLTETYAFLEVGNNHQRYSLELTKNEDIKEFVGNINAVDGIVHCAGVLKTLPFKFTNEEMIKDLMDVNFSAPAFFTKELLTKNKIQKNGSIVFLSSISGTQIVALGNSIYSATKAAIDSLSKSVALEAAPKKIRSNSICPGMIETGIFSENKITDEQFQLDMKKYPLKRYGKPQEVAFAAVYLLSDASRWVTGSSLLIDGGITLQ